MGERVDVASDRVTGDEVADMFQRFEDNTDFLDIDALRDKYLDVPWHSYADWAKTIDRDRVTR